MMQNGTYKKILVYLTHAQVDAWNFKPEHKGLLESRLSGTTVQICANPNEFKDNLPGANIAIVWFFKEEWLARAPRLKLIATPAAGKDWITWQPPENLKLSFGGFHGPIISESVLGAMLHFIKVFPLSKAMQQKKKWARVKISTQQQSLYKSRVTILGFGKIGITLGRFLKQFGCGITGIKRTEMDNPDYFNAQDNILTFDELESILPETDHFICALPGGEETKEIIRPRHFKKLPKRSFLYNVGRGNIYKESDLVRALQSEEIAGAYLDVFGEEPLPKTSTLWELNNVLIQPHISAASPQYLELFVEELAQKIKGQTRWK
ncbi:MAG: D-2-hydroxyacid dehydrogenase [Nitrospinota bacterium]|nr:D-2-hydroxyacid dehydrogenase [Nitrospinota bacterium]MEC9018874.1 D-2-hydroxyacid dehydrogenase [Nitrospinota bacterium]MEC9423411.1 D-2-hydroxyacid dehydrogenase [Nitrospinota bacterium]MED5353850.1 D-2-hydroxyacid dehydrogenase [Nitrospinota bacterium]